MPTLAQVSALFTNAGLAAAGAAAISVPIAIHLLTRLRRRTQPWAAMRFLLEAFRRQRRRLQLEQLLLLLLRCAILLILGLALAGPLMGGLATSLGIDPSGRLLCIVIDDAMSTQVPADAQQSRFDGLRTAAAKLIDQLRPGDRVAIISAGRPARGLVTPPTIDHDHARRTLNALTPRDVRADWPAALVAASQLVAQQRTDPERTFVVALSDFAVGSLDASRPAPAEVAGLGQKARVFVARPAGEAANIQLESVEPRRLSVLPDLLGRSVASIDLKLRRFGGSTADATVGVELAVIDQDAGKPIGILKRDARFATGQDQATLSVELPLTSFGAQAGDATQPAPTTAPASSSAAPPTGSRMLAVRARLDTGAAGATGGGSGATSAGASAGDSLVADNTRWSMIESRGQLHVAVLDDRASTASVAEGDLPPSQWLALALNPLGTTRGPITTTDVSAVNFDERALKGIDVAIVLRPDLVSAPGWSVLKEFASAGGCVWGFMPPSPGPAMWAATMRERMGLKWRFGVETRDAAPTDEEKRDGREGSWPLVTDASTPESLRLLAADWGSLLKPIRVQRRLNVAVNDSSEAVWLRVADMSGAGAASQPGNASTNNAGGTSGTASGATSGGGGGGDALLAVAPIGEGHFLFYAAALDTRWSNLTTKPLFIPLLHETLRSTLGGTAEMRRLSALVCGDVTTLGRRWDGTESLAHLTQDAAVLVRRTDAGLETANAFERTGVYAARPGSIAMRLPVNPDARAGDTRALDASVLTGWLDALGKWTWLDPANASLGVEHRATRANLGWPLLWTTLVLLLLELCLARWFSHAKAS